MDFHMLTRRDLQALCKRNKIPANITNVAMAESLKALEFVEGIEEFSQTCQSETAQSSIESPVKMEVTSPYVPPTGGRSTRRRNVVKDEPETAKPSARASRTTRKVQTASACKKMDFESKDCKEEEKSGVSVTPAPSAVTTRRRRGVKEESVVTHTYSTRRSTRLSVKNVQLLNEVGSENLDFSKKELFTNDCQESKVISNEGPCDSDEVSGITGGVDAVINVEVNSEKEVEAEIISAEKQDMSAIDMEEPVPAIEDEVSNQSEADGAKLELNDTCNVEIEEVGFGSVTEAEAEKEECDKTEAPNDEVVSAEKHDMSTIDIVEPVPTIEDEVSNLSEAVGAKLELKDTCDVEIEEVGFGSETESEAPNDEINAEENNGSLDDVNTSEIEVDVVKIEQNQAVVNYGENVVLESEVSNDVQPSEIKMDVEKTEEQTTDKDDNGDLEIEQQNTDKDAESEDEVVNCEENSDIESEDDSTVSEVSEDETEENDSTASEVSEDETEINANVHGDLGEKEIEEEVSKWETVFAYVNEKHEAVVEDGTKDAQVLPCLTPIKASAKKTVVSDNKENNIKTTKGSNEQLVEELKQMSVRKLTKMVKEKLNIANKSSLNENDNKAARTALQVLPENHKA